MSEWKECKLGDICSKVTSGGTPNTRKNEYYGGKIPWVRTQEVNFNRIYDAEIKITEDGLNNSSAKWIPENSVIIAMYGATAGKVAINKIPVTTNQACCNLIIDNDKADYRFVYYNILSRFSSIANMAVGGAQQNLNAGMIKDLPLYLPDLPTQTSIAEILSSLDDKIELNNKINQELETLAQNLFKQWFIDFEFPNEKGEPYKSSGGEMVDSELGEIPKEWKNGTFGDVIKKENLKVKKSESIVNKVYSAVKTSELVLSDEYFTKKVYSKSIDNYYVVKNHCFAYNPSRINIGSIGLNKSDIGAVSPVYVVFSTKNYFHFFIEYTLQLENTKNAIIQRCSGTVRQALNYEGLSSIPLIIPNDKLVIKFNDFIENNTKHLSLIRNETQQLINLRDSLLPKLISGELEINEINN